MTLTNKILLALAFLCFGHIDAMEPENPWPLHDAVTKKENPLVLRNLIARTHNLNQCNSDGHTPLLLACKLGNDAAVEALLGNFARISPSLFIPDRHFFGYLPIHYICQYSNNTKLLTLMLLAAQERNESQRLLESEAELGSCPLHVAITSNKPELAKLLVQNGADIRARDRMGHSPMTLAVIQCEELLPWLLDQGVDPNTTINELGPLPYADTGLPVLHLACRENKPNAVRLLLAHGADPNMLQNSRFSSLNSAAHIAARLKSNACIEELLKSPRINLNARNCTHNTPLHEACMVSPPDLTIIEKLVIAARTSVNALNNRGENTLTVLCLRHKFNYDLSKIIRYLISQGAERSYLCLHGAALANDTQMIEFLLKNGWDIDAKDPQGNTILHKLINKLEQAKLMYFGHSRLIKAAEEKVSATIKFIEKMRARANLQNNGQKTAIDLREILKKESERDIILPRPQIKKPSKYPLLPDYESDDTTFYKREQIIIKENRNGKIIYIRIEETSPWCFQSIATPIVVYKKQDTKREDDRDQSHNFSLLVDSYIGAGAYLDLDSKNDPKIARLLELIQLKFLRQDQFAVILKGKICDKLKCDDKKVPELFEKQGVNGVFVYLFDKKSKTCFHRQFHSVKKENEKEFQECLKCLEDQGQNIIRGYSIDPQRTPACLFSS